MVNRITAEEANASGLPCSHGHVGRWRETSKVTNGVTYVSRCCQACFAKYKARDRYGLSFAEYQALVEKQKGRCAACNKPKRLNVDHCHKTGAVRGLICHGCNNIAASLEHPLAASVEEYLNGWRDKVPQ